MKLIAFATQGEKSEDTFDVSAIEGGYRINKGELSIDITPDLFKPCEVQYLVIGQRELGLIPQSLYVDSRDWASVMRHRDFYRMFGAVYFGPTADESVLIISSKMFADGVDAIEQDFAPYAQAASTVCPSAAAVRRRNAAKLELVAKINPLDSLSALEKQLDLLTALVLTLAAKQPKDEQPEWLESLSQTYAATASVEPLNIDKAIRSMGDYKAHVREVQDQYFKSRSGGV